MDLKSVVRGGLRKIFNGVVYDIILAKRDVREVVAV